MPASAFNLTGNVELNAGGAVRSANELSQRFKALSNNSRTTAQTLKVTAQAMNSAASAAEKERRSLAALATQQERLNAIQRQSRANAGLTRARTGAVVSDAEGRRAVAEGRAQLETNRALTETVRQRIVVEDAEGRAAVRASQIASAATRDRIAQERLLLQQQRAAAEEQAAAQATAFRATSNTRAAVSGLASTALHTGVVTGAIFVGLAANAVLMERQFANVVRTSDILDKGLSRAGQNRAIDKLRLQFDALAQTLPISYQELTEIGAAANQLGVSSGNLSSFTKTVAQFSATTGVSVDTASTAFGRLDSLIPDVAHNYQDLADSINKVGVNSVATDQQIINIASQISGVAASAGLGYKSIIGFSGALASVAISPYLARGLTTRLFTDISNAASDGGDELIKFAQVAGVSADQFKAAWEGTQSQKQGVLLKLFDGIRKAGPEAVNILKDLGVKSVLDQPALIRLANAADSTGKAGALLAQTFRDANTAAGENAKQYAVIASTLQGKLQVGLNRTQILLRNIGEANIGPLGATIDTISASVLSLSQNLTQPIKLLGQFNLPFTNAQALGFATLALGAVAAFTLLVGAGAKVVASFVAVREGAAALRQVIASTGERFGIYASGANAAAAANLRLAESQRAIATTRAAATLGSNRVTAENSAFAQTSILQNYAATAKNAILTSNNRIVSSLVNVGQRGTAAFRTIASGARAAGGAIVNGLFSPIGLGIGAAITGLIALDNRMRQIGSSAGDASVGITKAVNATQILTSTKVSGAVDGVAALWDQSTQSFLKSTDQLKASLDGLGEGGALNDFAAKFRSVFNEGALNKGFNYTTEGLDKIDAGFANLAQSGNLDAAVQGFQTFSKGLTNQEIQNALAHMPGTLAALNSKLNENGLTAGADSKNIIALAHSNKVLTDNLTPAQKAVKAQADALSNAVGAGADYINGTKQAAAASIDLNAAFKSLKAPNLNDFFAAAKQQFDDFANQSANIATIAGNIGPEYVAQLSQLDPGILALAVKTKGGMDKLKTALDRKNLLDGLRQNFAQLDNDPKLLTAFAGLPEKLRAKITESLSKGNSIEDAFRAAGQKGIDAFNSSVDSNDKKIKLEADPTALNKSLANLSTKGAKALQVKITGDAGPAITTGESAAKIISNLSAYIRTNADTVLAVRAGESTASYIDRLQSTLTVLGDTSFATDASQSAAYQIGQLQARILVDADPNLAKRTATEATTEINKLTAQLRINGDAQPAHAAGATAAEDISRLVARLVVDADTKLAASKGQGTAAEISQLKGIITILGNDAPAQKKGESSKAYIDRLKGTISILGDNSKAIAATDAATRKANGARGTINVNANTSSASAAIDYAARNRTATITVATVGSISGGTGSNGVSGHARARGGSVRGPGTHVSDSIPARLSNGEFVVRATQAAKNINLLNAINNGVAQYATGGRVAMGSAAYGNSAASVRSSNTATLIRDTNVSTNITELSAYDRHLLQNIADRVGITIEPSHIAQATTGVYRKQSQRGNG